MKKFPLSIAKLTKTAAITGLMVMTAAPSTHASTAMAPSEEKLSKATQAKQGATVISSVLVGTAAGGPAGAFIGLLASSFMVDTLADAERGEKASVSLAEAEAEKATLRRELMAARAQSDKLEQLALNSLEFQVLFHTGKDELSPRGEERIHSLAQLLQEYPQLQIRLDGHADPRGTDGYNQVLSQYRAHSVANNLIAAGISAKRIDSYAHGASQSTATIGSAEEYAQERRVGIQIFNPEQQQDVVAAH